MSDFKKGDKVFIKTKEIIDKYIDEIVFYDDIYIINEIEKVNNANYGEINNKKIKLILNNELENVLRNDEYELKPKIFQSFRKKEYVIKEKINYTHERRNIYPGVYRFILNDGTELITDDYMLIDENGNSINNPIYKPIYENGKPIGGKKCYIKKNKKNITKPKTNKKHKTNKKRKTNRRHVK